MATKKQTAGKTANKSADNGAKFAAVFNNAKTEAEGKKILDYMVAGFTEAFKAKFPSTEAKEKKGASKKPETKAKAEKKVSSLTLGGEVVEQISITDTKAMKKLGLTFIPYSDKCFLIGGNTKPIHKELKKMTGVFGNGHLKPVEGFEGGFSWLVNQKNVESVAKALGVKAPKTKA